MLEKFVQLVRDNPEVQVMYFYPGGVYTEVEGEYVEGTIQRVIHDKCWEDGAGRLWFKGEDECELMDEYIDQVWSEHYDASEELTDEDEKELERLTKEFINSQEWEDCICLFIS